MKKYLYTLLTIGAFIFLAQTNTNAQGVVGQILDRMDAHNKALSTLRANVKMDKYNSQLKVSDSMNGSVIYVARKGKDALVRVDWVKPKEILRLQDKKYLIFRPELNQYYTGSVNSKMKDSSSAGGSLAFINMSKADLRRNYNVELISDNDKVGSVDAFLIRLTPKTAGNYKSADVWIDKDGMPIQSKLLEKNNDTTTVLLTNLKKNTDVEVRSEFNVVIPKTAKQIKS